MLASPTLINYIHVTEKFNLAQTFEEGERDI